MGMAASKDLSQSSKVILSGMLTLPVLAAGTGSIVAIMAGLFLSLLLFSFYILFNFQLFANSFETFCRYGLGILYIGYLIPHLVLLRQMPDGAAWLVILTSITAGSDSGAYYCGKAFGSRKLSPHISPKKTIEGAMGGLLFGTLFSVLFAWMLLPKINWWFLIPVSALLTCVGIVGDLTESVIKRGTDTKDSGWILAGHGGVLDRVDSLLFAGPLLYYLLVFAGK